MKLIAVEYGDWIPAPLRRNPNLGWDFNEKLLQNSPPKKYCLMIWRQEYYWQRDTEQYLCRGFWATGAFRDPAMIKILDDRVRIMVGGEFSRVEEEEIVLKDLLARSPPRYGAYTVREELFLSFIEEFIPVDRGMVNFRSRWQLCYDVPVDEAWETVGHRSLAEGRQARREQRRRARLYH
ncbi:uncharacterized protein LOC122500779 [Leptopilina heterotoma]|uniref:uncharacterized protein LOC122500779 n=1 Tax=Leptopilina heterotoma TaxID=63436 RepID=UPI001CA88AB2|nr:uncharacterized protein LOC122500779 [Leptopilina heterotoma]